MRHSNNFYQDAGHGWLEVDLKDLCALGICQKISNYSYVRYISGRDIKVYLEEDQDAGVYLKAYKNKYGKDLEIINIHQDRSFIRDLLRFDSQAPVLKELQEAYFNLITINKKEV